MTLRWAEGGPDEGGFASGCIELNVIAGCCMVPPLLKITLDWEQFREWPMLPTLHQAALWVLPAA